MLQRYMTFGQPTQSSEPGTEEVSLVIPQPVVEYVRACGAAPFLLHALQLEPDQTKRPERRMLRGLLGA